MPLSRDRPRELVHRARTESEASTPPSGEPLSDKNGIRVIIRVRPMLSHERGSESIVEVVPPSVELRNPPVPGVAQSTKSYSFHNSFGEAVDQGQFFEESGVQWLLDRSMEGFNSTVFAYGQTGSGKTYTMTGPDDDIVNGGLQTPAQEGVLQRSMRYLLSRRPSPFRVSYCEVYNEFVYDLLNLDSANLQVRYHERNGFFDVMEVITEGRRNRTVGSHELNKDSSRSHSLLTVYLDPSSVRSSKVTFVDLAGSERLSATKVEGVMKKEAGSINKSLLTLAKVIMALSNRESHIPYRDSTLSKLLMDSLGGNAYTLMITNIAPCSQYHEITLSTLKYAARASRIQNAPTKLGDPKDMMISNLRTEIELLKHENEQLRTTVLTPRTPVATVAPSPAAAAVPGCPPAGAPTSDRRVQYDQINELIKKYELEINKVRGENGALLARYTAMEETCNMLYAENDDLYKRLDNLERLFGVSAPRPPPPPSQKSVVPK